MPPKRDTRRTSGNAVGLNCGLNHLGGCDHSILQSGRQNQANSRAVARQQALRSALRQALERASRGIDTARSARDDLTLARAIVLTARHLNDAYDLLGAATGKGRLS